MEANSHSQYYELLLKGFLILEAFSIVFSFTIHNNQRLSKRFGIRSLKIMVVKTLTMAIIVLGVATDMRRGGRERIKDVDAFRGGCMPNLAIGLALGCRPKIK